MPAFILDASVAISWCFPGDPTEDAPYSRRVLKELVANDAIVPEIWAFEIANNIFVSYRKRKRISEQQIAALRFSSAYGTKRKCCWRFQMPRFPGRWRRSLPVP